MTVYKVRDVFGRYEKHLIDLRWPVRLYIYILKNLKKNFAYPYLEMCQV